MTAHNQPCAVLPDRRAKPYAMEPKGMADTICELDPLEPIFRAIVYAILREPGVLTRGSIIDAGANDGQDSCMYASLQPDRVVHAVEPSLLNVQHIQKKYAALTNLRILHGGLGNTDRDMSMRGPNTPAPVGVSLQDIDMRLSTARRGADIKAGSFHVYKLDDLLLNETGAWKHEHLAFAHFDVEGGELKLLQGGKNAILRDRPVFTVEIYPHRRPRDARAILQYLDDTLSYETLLVEEVCGLPLDCRNILAVPRERASSIRSSPPLLLAEGRHHLFPVSADNVTLYGYPCCRFGSPCCSHWPTRKGCCDLASVDAWFRQGASRHGLAFLGRMSHWPAALPSVAIRKSYRLPNATEPLFSDALAAGTRSQELLR
jgi:FkbM family methyltransferase